MYVYDEETGLYYLRSRYYNCESIRFMNADEILKGNLFSYCKCRPTISNDSDGKDPSMAIFESVTELKLSINFLAFNSEMLFEEKYGIPTTIMINGTNGYMLEYIDEYSFTLDAKQAVAWSDSWDKYSTAGSFSFLNIEYKDNYQYPVATGMNSFRFPASQETSEIVPGEHKLIVASYAKDDHINNGTIHIALFKFITPSTTSALYSDKWFYYQHHVASEKKGIFYENVMLSNIFRLLNIKYQELTE